MIFEYNDECGVAAAELMTAKHKVGVLKYDTIEALANVYYRMVFLAAHPDIALSDRIEEDMRLRIRFLSEAKFIENYAEGLISSVIDLKAKKGGLFGGVVLGVIEEDFVDTFKYGIEDVGNKSGWQKSKERKAAIIYDIDDIIQKMKRSLGYT